jgi:Rrf2 family protein
MAASSRFAAAAHILVYLAYRAPAAASSAEIARSVSTHPVFVRRLLALLARNDLVHSNRGSQGGFTLARPAEEIRMSEVYAAVESKPVLGHRECCSDQARVCPINAGITPSLRRLSVRAQNAVEIELAKISVADVLRETRG